MNSFGFLDLGAPELIIILAIVLLLFGGKKLPELSRSLGASMREIKNGMSSTDDAPKKTDNKPTE
ncbi:MAG TPA: twin-arginine translocase TatA/TatE family subunit [Candidatus Saccharimonadales bacterium]|jgi:sec-independent protein translocase protein TatA|nr:twin-arginine translocase TatA/TatE family subunit [Candidatus Saccharimonadales bacterium]